MGSHINHDLAHQITNHQNKIWEGSKVTSKFRINNRKDLMWEIIIPTEVVRADLKW